MKYIKLLPSIIFPIIAICIFIISGCNKTVSIPTENAKFVLSDTMRKMISLDTVKMVPLKNEVSLTGQVDFDADKVEKIFPQVSGHTVSVSVQLGDHVQQSQTLAVIKSTDVAGFASDLIAAKSHVLLAQKNLNAARDMYKAGLASQIDFMNAQQDSELAASQYQKAKEVLKINNAGSGSDYVVKSPISGYIVEKKINPGIDIRSDAGDNIFTISDMKDVWVWANVYEADIPKVQQGYPVQVNILAYPDKTFYGKIDKLSEMLDPVSKSLRARISIDNPDNFLRPQMFANVSVSNQKGEALYIPTSALIMLNGKQYVVVYKNTANVRNQEVDVLNTVGDKTYIKGGLQPGDVIVSKNQLLIFNQLLNN